MLLALLRTSYTKKRSQTSLPLAAAAICWFTQAFAHPRRISITFYMTFGDLFDKGRLGHRSQCR